MIFISVLLFLNKFFFYDSEIYEYTSKKNLVLEVCILIQEGRYRDIYKSVRKLFETCNININKITSYKEFVRYCKFILEIMLFFEMGNIFLFVLPSIISAHIFLYPLKLLGYIY